MKTVRGLDALGEEAIPPTGSSVVIGTFDGVHLGHQSLIRAGLDRARALGVVSCCVTWDRHPTETLAPGAVPPLITSFARKEELLDALGLDLLLVLAFDEAFVAWTPGRFISEVLSGGLGARAVTVGRGFRFGHRAAGDTVLLAQLGERLGFEVAAAGLVEAEGRRVSSTRVRAVIAEGDVALAGRLLGRPWDLDGVVVRGDRRGTSLGYPTANIEFDPSLVHPPSGVYAGRARAGGAWFTAAVNVGVNPTFTPEIRPRMEAYLLDFTGDLYDRWVRVELWVRLRDELRFASVEELVDQIGRDVVATREVVESAAEMGGRGGSRAWPGPRETG